jgi:3-deoxy-manno-octulosonate cytidylyltransferase (CMP-KDO synthetase)
MESSRFPGKVLWKFLDMPMIEHVYRRACMALNSQHIYIASGDSEVLNYMKSIGANVTKSNRTHNDGTSRAAEAVEDLTYDYVVVLQADEILIDPNHLIELLNSIKSNPNTKFWNLVSHLNSELELNDHNIVKCALNIRSEVMFMFRQNPFTSVNPKIFNKVMGTIAFERKSLISLTNELDSLYQLANSTEQLKILEYGNTLLGVLISNGYPSVNSPSDIEVVRNFSHKDSSQVKILKNYAS